MLIFCLLLRAADECQPACCSFRVVIIVLTFISSTRHISQIPYYGYARQDRKTQAGVPISAANAVRFLESMGVDRVIAVDLHCRQIQGFFGPRVPVNNLNGGIVGINRFGGEDLYNTGLVSPNAAASIASRSSRRASPTSMAGRTLASP